MEVNKFEFMNEFHKQNQRCVTDESLSWHKPHMGEWHMSDDEGKCFIFYFEHKGYCKAYCNGDMYMKMLDE